MKNLFKTLLCLLMVVACSKNEEVIGIPDVKIENNKSNVTDLFGAFNTLNLPTNPQPSSGKGDNYLDIAFFSHEGSEYIYVRSDDYTGAATCYAFVDETLASYTLNDNNTLLLETNLTSITYDVEAGLYDNVFSTSYNDLFGRDANGNAIPTTVDPSIFRFDGDCLLSGLINGASNVFNNYGVSIENHNAYGNIIREYAYSTSQQWNRVLSSLQQVGDRASLNQYSFNVPSRNNVEFVILSLLSRNSGDFSDTEKIVLLRVVDNIGNNYILEVIETNYSGSWNSSWLTSSSYQAFIQVVYSDRDRDGDGVIDWEDFFPDDPNEQLDDDNDGIGNNSDTLPLIDTSSYYEGNYDVNGNGSRYQSLSFSNITELGTIVDSQPSAVYLEGHIGTDGESIVIGVPNRSNLLRTTVNHTSIAGNDLTSLTIDSSWDSSNGLVNQTVYRLEE